MTKRHLVFVVGSLAFAACSTGYGGEFDGSLLHPDGGPGRDAGRPGVDAGDRVDAGLPAGCSREMCNNGLDDNCNGAVDENCPCLPGEVAACFRGPASARGQGACADGSMTCESGLEFGTWGACDGDVLPADEVCDAANADESCDGAANEGCECTPGSTVACGTDEGACTPGTQECVDGMLGACTGQVGPTTEACNNADDDCDGMIDEAISQACGMDRGECRMGTQTCVAGVFDVCEGGRDASPEICDGLDNNCDGSTDEGLSQACGSDVGDCSMGSQACADGRWGTCTGATSPMLETCNNSDEDCDSRIDEGVTQACGSSTGICRPGSQTCTAGSFGLCTGGTGPGNETCDGTRDENCDGTVDEGCGCTNGQTRACGTNTGECTAGMQTCDVTGNWGSCIGSVGPRPEICNSRDDNCDGMIDEGGVCPTAPPVVMCPGAMSAGVLTLLSLAGSGSDPDGGTVTYQWTVTARPTGSAAQPTAPTSAITNFFLDASGNYTLQLCVTDNEGERACCTTGITSNPPGGIHVELGWNTVYGDLDLHLLNVNQTDPNGWFTRNDCFWGSSQLVPPPDWGPAGAQANATLDIDDTDGNGPENITITDRPQAGTYSVGLHYYCSHSIGSGTLGMGDGPTSATVRIYCDGVLRQTYTGLSLQETDDWLTTAEIDYPSCNVRMRSRATNASSFLPAGVREFHCPITCTSNAQCPTSEVCARVTGNRYQCVHL